MSRPSGQTIHASSHPRPCAGLTFFRHRSGSNPHPATLAIIRCNCHTENNHGFKIISRTTYILRKYRQNGHSLFRLDLGNHPYVRPEYTNHNPGIPALRMMEMGTDEGLQTDGV